MRDKRDSVGLKNTPVEYIAQEVSKDNSINTLYMYIYEHQAVPLTPSFPCKVTENTYHIRKYPLISQSLTLSNHTNGTPSPSCLASIPTCETPPPASILNWTGEHWSTTSSPNSSMDTRPSQNSPDMCSRFTTPLSSPKRVPSRMRSWHCASSSSSSSSQSRTMVAFP